MSFFVDANVIIYAGSGSDRQEACVEILRAIALGEADGRTSTAVLEEVWHVELGDRQGRITGITERAYSTFAPLLSVTDEVFRGALGLAVAGLGANDRVHVATALANGIDTILTADASFEGIRGLRRVDPFDERSRRRLLRGGR